MTWQTTIEVSAVLRSHHYLGPSRRGFAWSDEFGVIVLASPTARNVPKHWLELVRWCITSDEKNAGSRQWAALIRAIRRDHPNYTTVVSYSDPAVGHTGALYRACNWLWAPTWHRLRPPPTGNGSWKDGAVSSVKDRWIFPISPDADRVHRLTIDDGGVLKRFPWAVYSEPGGVPFSKWKESGNAVFFAPNHAGQ